MILHQSHSMLRTRYNYYTNETSLVGTKECGGRHVIVHAQHDVRRVLLLRSALASTAEKVCCSTAEPQGKQLSESSCSFSSRPQRVELQAQEASQGCLYGEGCSTGPIARLSTAAKSGVFVLPSFVCLFGMYGCVLPYDLLHNISVVQIDSVPVSNASYRELYSESLIKRALFVRAVGTRTRRALLRERPAQPFRANPKSACLHHPFRSGTFWRAIRPSLRYLLYRAGSDF